MNQCFLDDAINLRPARHLVNKASKSRLHIVCTITGEAWTDPSDLLRVETLISYLARFHHTLVFLSLTPDLKSEARQDPVPAPLLTKHLQKLVRRQAQALPNP